MGEDRRRVARIVGEARGQRAAYGVGWDVPFQPGADGRGQKLDVRLREQQARVVTAEAGQECDGGAEADGVLGRGCGERRFWGRWGSGDSALGRALKC